MSLMTLAWGVLAYAAMVIGLLPVLAGLNWFTVPFAGLGVVLSLVALLIYRGRRDGAPIAALVCNLIAMTIGLLRLRGGFGF